jgi:hypothetical protein
MKDENAKMWGLAFILVVVFSFIGPCVYQSADSAAYMACKAMYRYNNLEPGKTYRVKVVGWSPGCPGSPGPPILELEEVPEEGK